MRADPTIAPRILITRSMLVARLLIIVSRAQPTQYTYLQHVFGRETGDVIVDRRARERRWRQKLVAVDNHRSEEHTSELQSRPHLVCRLLLEKKKSTASGSSMMV